jgi:hypothetical protein
VKLIKALALLTEATTMAAVWLQFLLFSKREYIQHDMFWIPVPFVFQPIYCVLDGERKVNRLSFRLRPH